MGFAAGWFVPRVPAATFGHVYAVLSPAGLAGICITALLGSSERARWLVPLVLVAVVLNVVNHPHVSSLTAVAVAAGAVASATTLCRRNRIAIVGTLVCCASMSASLLIGLRQG
jgi:hypothetical protein